MYESLVVSFGWFGAGFALTRSPEFEFIADNLGEKTAWQEKSIPSLQFADTNDLVRFCISKLCDPGGGRN